MQRDPKSDYVGQGFAVDGDSLRIGAERIRLLGIDALEYDQVCKDQYGASWPCGLNARDHLAALISQREITCAGEGRDQYGRVLAICTIANMDLGAAMVEQGLAVADGRYRTMESAARTHQRGIWQGEFVRPAAWRRGVHSIDQDDGLLAGWLDRLFH